MKYFTAAAAAVALSFSAGAATAACDAGEIVIKFGLDRFLIILFGENLFIKNP